MSEIVLTEFQLSVLRVLDGPLGVYGIARALFKWLLPKHRVGTGSTAALQKQQLGQVAAALDELIKLKLVYRRDGIPSSMRQRSRDCYQRTDAGHNLVSQWNEPARRSKP